MKFSGDRENSTSADTHTPTHKPMAPSDKTTKRSCLAEDDVSLAHILGEFQPTLSGKVWPRGNSDQGRRSVGWYQLVPMVTDVNQEKETRTETK